MFPNDPPQRRVVCAALRNKQGHIICGARHYDEVMRSQLKLAVLAGPEWDSIQDITQGFIDQWGIFLSRAEALEVAKAANQIIKRCGGDSTELYSENIY
jgi:hypothetical protein